jgi:hypothetical protein
VFEAPDRSCPIVADDHSCTLIGHEGFEHAGVIEAPVGCRTENKARLCVLHDEGYFSCPVYRDNWIADCANPHGSQDDQYRLNAVWHLVANGVAGPSAEGKQPLGEGFCLPDKVGVGRPSGWMNHRGLIRPLTQGAVEVVP